MDRLSIVLSLVTNAVCVGTALIVVLVLGFYSWQAIVAAIVVGMIASYPAAWLWAKQIKRDDPYWNERKERPA